MAQPPYSQIHVDKFLTNMSVAMLQDPEKFIAGKVFTEVGTKTQSDSYPVYDMADFRRDEAQLRAAATESEGGGYNVSPDTYFCQKYGYHKDVTPEDRINSDSPLAADIDALDFVTEKFLILKERIWRDSFFQLAVWDNDLVGGAAAGPGVDFIQWDQALGVPIQDIKDAQLLVGNQTGIKLDTLIMSPPVRYALDTNPDILARIVYGGTPGSPAVVNDAAIAQALGVNRILVPWGVINTAVEGAAEYTNWIYGNNALLTYTDNQAGLKKPVSGRIFNWTGLLGAGAAGMRINRLPMDLLGPGTQRIEGEAAFDMKVVSSILGVFFSGAVA